MPFELPFDRTDLEARAAEAINEADRALQKHSPYNSTHEAYAVLLEETDELWDEIKKRDPDQLCIYREALQVASVALRIAAAARNIQFAPDGVVK